MVRVDSHLQIVIICCMHPQGLEAALGRHILRQSESWERQEEWMGMKWGWRKNKKTTCSSRHALTIFIPWLTSWLGIPSVTQFTSAKCPSQCRTEWSSIQFHYHKTIPLSFSACLSSTLCWYVQKVCIRRYNKRARTISQSQRNKRKEGSTNIDE